MMSRQKDCRNFLDQSTFVDFEVDRPRRRTILLPVMVSARPHQPSWHVQGVEFGISLASQSTTSPGQRQCDDGNEKGSDVGRLHSGHATSNDGRPDRVIYSESTSYPLNLPPRRPLPRAQRLIDSDYVVTLILHVDDW